jgi:[acyl-carrier-protein] S-malonyltransferase
VLEALPGADPLLERASARLGYDLRKRVEVAARRKGATLPTVLAQPAIFVAGAISFSAARDEGGRWDAFAGHSLGEYTALVAAGALTFEDALDVVRVRGEAMEAAGRRRPGTMAAVLGLELDEISDIARRCGVEVANDNSPGQVVLSGSESGLAEAAGHIRAAGARSVLLEVSGAFHTSAMAEAAPAVHRELDRIDVARPQTPVVSNVTARPYEVESEIRELLVEQLTRRVRFRESLEWLLDEGAEDFSDFGPGRVVGALAQRTARARRTAEVPANA